MEEDFGTFGVEKHSAGLKGLLLQLQKSPENREKKSLSSRGTRCAYLDFPSLVEGFFAKEVS